MAFIPESNSVVAFQSDPTKLVATVSVVGTVPIAQTGTVISSISGTVVVVGNVTSETADAGDPVKVGGKYNATLASFASGQRGDLQIGSRGVLRTTLFVDNSPTAILSRADNADGIAVSATADKFAVVNRNTVYNGVGWDRMAGNSSIGTLVNTGVGSVITVNQSPSVIAVVTGSVVAIPTGNQSVSGEIGASLIGIATTSSGDGAGANNQLQVGSYTKVYNGSNWDRWRGNSSVGGLVYTGTSSVVAVLQAPSIVGTYSEDSGHTTGDKGIFVLGVRNDALSSMTSANTDYGALARDSAGRVLVKPYSPEESRIEGYNSVVSGSVTTLVAAAGAGIRNYITDVWLSNTGSVTTLVTFRSGGGTSVLGYTIAPAGNGSNLIGLLMPIRTLANETFDIQATTPNSVLYATVKGFKAP